MKKQLDLMLAKAVRAEGTCLSDDGNYVDLDKSTREFITQLAGITPDPVEQLKMLEAAWADKEVMRQLGALRVEQVANFIVAESTFMSMFFEQVQLRDDEEPAFVNETMNEVLIGRMGEDGKPDEVHVVKPEHKNTLAFRFLVSQKVKYKTLDVYRGRIADIAKKTFNISRDLAFKLDVEHKNLLNANLALGGAFGPFSYENGRTNNATKLYLAHSGIITANLPKTNDWDLTKAPGTTSTTQGITGVVMNPLSVATTKFGVPVLRAVEHYANLWANVLPGGGRLVPTGEILVPNGDVIAIAEDAAPVSNVAAQRIQEDINRDGYATLMYLGRLWKFIADVTIPSGVCYPRFNMLPGRTFFKTQFDREFVETNEEENWETRYQRKVYAAYIISQYRARSLRVKYA